MDPKRSWGRKEGRCVIAWIKKCRFGDTLCKKNELLSIDIGVMDTNWMKVNVNVYSELFLNRQILMRGRNRWILDLSYFIEISVASVGGHEKWVNDERTRMYTWYSAKIAKGKGWNIRSHYVVLRYFHLPFSSSYLSKKRFFFSIKLEIVFTSR